MVAPHRERNDVRALSRWEAWACWRSFASLFRLSRVSVHKLPISSAYGSFRFSPRLLWLIRTLAPTSINQIRSFEANPSRRS